MSTVTGAPLRVAVVDDEEPARLRLVGLLCADPEIEIAAVSTSGKEAIAAIEQQAPDLVFLDVQMPEIDGFDVIEAVGVARMPLVIFVSAFEAHALRAFDVRALDYLLKPFARARFEAALSRAKTELRLGPSARFAGALADLMSRPQVSPRDRLLVRDGDRIHVVPLHDLDWIQAAGNYVELHAGGKSHLMRSTLAALEERLDPGRFVRVHRDTIVQVERIRSVQRWPGGQYRVVLADGAERPIARRFQSRLEARLGKL
jgi:two-component system LytT family response regulator